MALTSTSLALLGLAALFIKHFLVDFVLQNGYQLRNKGTYGHPGGLLHSGLHALFSVAALLLFTSSASVIGAVCVVEFVLHYHMDWAKDHLVRHYGWKISDRAYWHAFGFDQLIHALTYVAIASYFLILA
ncbi:MAG: DUF3307 domain-containing protein [Hyphomonadaceae bacterium]